MTIVATLAQIPLMWAITLYGVIRDLNLYSKPSFETICDSFRVSPIQHWLPNTIAILTSLMPNDSIVLLITI